jgi:hypothetical protein
LLWGHRGVGHGLDAVLSRLELGAGNLRRHDARGDVELLARAIEIMWERLMALGRLELRCYEGRLPCE